MKDRERPPYPTDPGERATDAILRFIREGQAMARQMDCESAERNRRERIAIACMQGLISDPNVTKHGPPSKEAADKHFRMIAKGAIGYADALIAELDKEPT